MRATATAVKGILQRLERLTIRRRRYIMPAMAKAAKKEPKPKRKVVCASLPRDDYDRLVAFGVREEARSGLVPVDGTLAVMLIRRGLDVVEAEAEQPRERRKAG